MLISCDCSKEGDEVEPLSMFKCEVDLHAETFIYLEVIYGDYREIEM